MNSQSEGVAGPKLHRTYRSLMLNDILYGLREKYKVYIPEHITNKGVTEPIPQARRVLHDFHKRLFGVKTLRGMKQEQLSKFLYEVGVFWAVEQGIFVRTNGNQPENLKSKPLSTLWHLL